MTTPSHAPEAPIDRLRVLLNDARNGTPVTDPRPYEADELEEIIEALTALSALPAPWGEALSSSADADTHRAEDEAALVGDGPQQILASYLPMINATPLLLSLLYDADMLPEQTVTVRGAISVAAVCEAFKAGQEAAQPAATQVQEEKP